MGSYSPGSCATLLLIAATAARAISISGQGGLTVAVSPDGSYSVSVPDPAWRFAGSIGSPLSNLATQSGADGIGGAYSEIAFDFFTDAPRHAAIRSYYASRTVVFTVSLPYGGPNTFAFPSLASYPSGLHHIAFAGM